MNNIRPESITFAAHDFSPIQRKGEAPLLMRPSISYWQDAWWRLKQNRQAFYSLFIVLVMIFFTILGPFFWSVDPAAQDVNRISEVPTFQKKAVVLSEETPWEETVLLDIAESSDEVSARLLPASRSLIVLDIPSTQAVRLKWQPIPGASGYRIYRGKYAPQDGKSLGVPLQEVSGGNRVSYEDRFNLESKTYYYSVVAYSGGEESPHAVTQKVSVPSGVTLSEAKLIWPEAQPGMQINLPSHPFGTDYLGRDLLSRMIYGARVSLFIGFFAPFLATFFGVFLGGISGFFGGKIDNGLMRFTDFVLALPFLLFMILFKVAFGGGAGESGIAAMLTAMVLLSWTGPARLTRGQLLQLREADFVNASRLLGGRPLYIILRHLIPNTLGVILVSLTFAIPSAIFTEAFLSFIGMGVVPPTPSWGSMCNDGIQTFLTHPHEFFFPALFISVTVLAFNRLGDGLRDALDPKLRST
jgi:oligopeptide transport system permease protein